MSPGNRVKGQGNRVSYRLPGDDNPVDEVREFAHHSSDDRFRCKPTSSKTIPERLQCRVVSSRYQPRHVEREAQRLMSDATEHRAAAN